MAHLPVYRENNPPNVGVSPISSDRFRDVTVRRQRKKGGRGGRGKKTSFSSEGDSYIPFSKRLSHGAEGLDGTK